MIKNIEILEWCISCRNCETVCPKIFKVNPKSKVISNKYEWNESEILQAELMCPVNVIKVEKKWNISINFKDAVLEEKNYLTKDTLELKFNTENFNFKAWQYISLQMEDWKWKFSRSYSIALWDENNFTLTVKLLDKWRWANFLKKLKTWKKIKFLWALWNFYLKNTQKEKVFIATGTWLAPMIAMLEKTPADIKKTIIFWVRYEEDLYYLDKLKSFKNTEIVLKISRPSKDEYKKNKWRVTDYLSKIDLNSEVYICWNPQMVDSVREWLIERWHPIETIYNESFSISQEHNSIAKEIFINWNIPGTKYLSWFMILGSLIIIPIFYNNISTQLLWDISWWAVVFVMWIRPLADLFPKLWILAKLVYFRKAFWILSSLIIVTALAYKFFWNAQYFSYYFSLNNWSSYNSILSRLSEITWLILLITSNTISQKTLWIWWKRIQRLSYIYFISWWIVAAIWAPMKIYPAMAVVIFLWILAAFGLRIWK